MSAANDLLAERGRFIRQTYRELADLVRPLDAALGQIGLRVVRGPPLDASIASMMELSDRWNRKANGRLRSGIGSGGTGDGGG